MPNLAVKCLVTSRAAVKIVVKEPQSMTVARVIRYNGLAVLETGTSDNEGEPVSETFVAMIWKPRCCFCSDGGASQRTSWGFMGYLRLNRDPSYMIDWPHKRGWNSNVAWM